MWIGPLTAIFSLFLTPSTRGLAIPAVVAQGGCLYLYALPVRKAFRWRELKRYGGEKSLVVLLRASMRASAALQTDLVAMGVHIAASLVLHDAALRTADALEGGVLDAQADELRERLMLCRRMSFHPLGGIIVSSALQLVGRLSLSSQLMRAGNTNVPRRQPPAPHHLDRPALMMVPSG